MTTIITLTARIRSYPYISPSATIISNASTGTSGTSPEASSFLDQIIAQLQAGISNISGTVVGPAQPVTGQDKWNRGSLTDFSSVQKLVDNLGKAVDGLNNIVNILSKILQIIELFVSGFNSFSKIIESIIDYGEQTINNFVKDLKGGVYLNVIAPPAFLRNYSDQNPDYAEQCRGGFEGFLVRLQGSINNSRDPNRPNFSSDAVVGGMVILMDTESTDEVWNGLKQLGAMFNFVKLFGLNLTPPPPKGLKGRCGYFKKTLDANGNPIPAKDQVAKFGIKLEWESSSIISNYLVYRSTIPGGITQSVEYVPSTLMDDPDTNQPGLFTVAKDMLFSLFTKNPVTKPHRLEQVYNDPTFNNGNPVSVDSNVSGTTIIFIDEFVNEKVMEYFYVVKSGASGQNSMELPVEVKKCNDLIDLSNVIPHPAGHYEFISAGFGRMNSWSSIQVSMVVPWVVELAGILTDFLESMKGMTNDATDSFMNFLNQIKEKIQLYVGILNTVSYIIGVFKSFVIGPSIAFLELPPAKGGPNNFVQRIKDAQLPSGQASFSGSNGISVGIVIMYAGNEAVAAGISFIMSLFVKK
jgi:hypothetical protein